MSEAPRESAGRAGAVLPGEHPAPERRVGQDAEPELDARPGTTSCSMLRLSSEYSICVETSGARPGHGALPGRALRGAPAGPVRDPDVRRPAGAHRGVERRERLLDRGRVGPDVDLPEVDVVDAEPAQRQVEAAEQVAARGVHHPRAAAGADPGLGRDDHVVARDHVVEQPAEQLLRRAAAVRVRGVEQRAAGVDEGGELLAGLVLVGAGCPRSSVPGRVARPRGRSDPGTCAAWATP